MTDSAAHATNSLEFMHMWSDRKNNTIPLPLGPNINVSLPIYQTNKVGGDSEFDVGMIMFVSSELENAHIHDNTIAAPADGDNDDGDDL